MAGRDGDGQDDVDDPDCKDRLVTDEGDDGSGEHQPGEAFRCELGPEEGSGIEERRGRRQTWHVSAVVRC